MTVRLNVAVQHHPSRSRLLPRLEHVVDDIVVDPEPDGKPNPWRTYYHALKTTPDDATHRLVLQDDAIVCDDFLRLATQAVRQVPDALVALFVPWTLRRAGRDYTEACARNATMVRLPQYGNEWKPVVALVWPRAHATGLVKWADGARYTPGVSQQRSDDALAGRYVVASGVEVWATIPSLVEHADDEPSLIGNRHGGRRPRSAICYEQAPGIINWSLR